MAAIDHRRSPPPWKIVIFHSYVSLPEGNSGKLPVNQCQLSIELTVQNLVLRNLDKNPLLAIIHHCYGIGWGQIMIETTTHPWPTLGTHSSEIPFISFHNLAPSQNFTNLVIYCDTGYQQVPVGVTLLERSRGRLRKAGVPQNYT